MEVIKIGLFRFNAEKFHYIKPSLNYDKRSALDNYLKNGDNRFQWMVWQYEKVDDDQVNTQSIICHCHEGEQLMGLRLIHDLCTDHQFWVIE